MPGGERIYIDDRRQFLKTDIEEDIMKT